VIFLHDLALVLICAEPDFQQQKGRLQEELDSTEQELTSYPKFHYELNFIERF
jgi:hypothetical protein